MVENLATRCFGKIFLEEYAWSRIVETVLACNFPSPWIFGGAEIFEKQMVRHIYYYFHHFLL